MEERKEEPSRSSVAATEAAAKALLKKKYIEESCLSGEKQRERLLRRLSRASFLLPRHGARGKSHEHRGSHL